MDLLELAVAHAGEPSDLKASLHKINSCFSGLDITSIACNSLRVSCSFLSDDVEGAKSIQNCDKQLSENVSLLVCCQSAFKFNLPILPARSLSQAFRDQLQNEQHLMKL